MQTNQLYYGDNLYVLRERIESESVDLVYIDPPFSSARNYFVIFKDRTGEASTAQSDAFTDTWDWGEEADAAYREIVSPLGPAQMGRHNPALAATIHALREMLHESPMMAYLVSMAVRLWELHRVLKPTGSFFLHCDPTASHYLKMLCDGIFGPRNFRNEIIWQRTNAKSLASTRLACNHDVILRYSKSDRWTSNNLYTGHDPTYVEKFYRHVESGSGRRYQLDNLVNPNRDRPNLTYEFLGVTRVWRWTKERMEKAYEDGIVVQTSPGAVPRLKRYLDEQKGNPIGDTWCDIPPISAQAEERLGYPTQKPLALMRRIIEIASNPGDVVLDAFCGCGTTVHAAHQTGRRWIGIDITSVAIGVIRDRMEQTFVEERLVVPVIGLPEDLEGARTLFEADPHEFQKWANSLIGSASLLKKGRDNGIDGWMHFYDYDESHHKAVVQVKGGKLTLSSVRDFCHVVTREKATLGFFLCLEEPTKAMNLEALKMGVWESAGGAEYPRVQLLTIGDLIAGKVAARYPRQEKKSALGFKAGKTQKATDKNLTLDY